MTAARAPVNVDYIGAVARSGTTLLHLVLGATEGRVAVGEVRYIWERGVHEDQLCGCGLRFSACPFWEEVGQQAFGGWDSVDLDEIIELHRAVTRGRHLLRLLFDPDQTKFSRKAGKYAAVLERLYRAIGDVADANIIVDSSKSPSYAALLHRSRGLEPRLIQLVRDSRGVAFSRTKRVRRPEVNSGPAYMGQFHPLRTALTWIRFNLSFDLLRMRGMRTSALTYDSFVADPLRVLRQLDALPDPDLAQMLASGVVTRTATHAVSGNPLRMTQDDTLIRSDDAWIDGLPLRHKIGVTVLTAPLLIRYHQRLGW